MSAGEFVEQRIMSAFSAIEHLMWTRLVTLGGMSRTKYEDKGFPAHEKLSAVLDEVGIDGGIDNDELPALPSAASRRPSNVPRTGPAIACHVRNLIVHPTDHEDELYRRDEKLVQQAWFLTQHYLVLLILYHLGYTGAYQRRLAPGGWADDVEQVPWAA